MFRVTRASSLFLQWRGWFCVLLLIVGCSAESTPAPTSTPLPALAQLPTTTPTLAPTKTARPTFTPLPTSTPIPTNTAQAMPRETATSEPTATATATVTASPTLAPTRPLATPLTVVEATFPPTSLPKPPATATPTPTVLVNPTLPPTETLIRPTKTPLLTATPLPPTPIPPTATPLPPTPIPPTATPLPPTPIPATATPLPPPTPAFVPLGQLGQLADGTVVSVQGQVVSTSSFSKGFKFTLSDSSGRATLLMWHNVYDDCYDKAGLNVGAMVTVTGEKGQFEGELQIEPRYGSQVKVTKPAGAYGQEVKGDQLRNYVNQRVMVVGQLQRGKVNENGAEIYINDGTGEIRIWIWKGTYDRIPNNAVLLTEGRQVRIVGVVDEYNGRFSVTPVLPYDVVLP